MTMPFIELYFEKGYFGNLTEAEAKKAFDTLQDSAREYMLEMGVPNTSKGRARNTV